MSKTKQWRFLAVPAVVLVLLAGCSESDDSLEGSVVKDALGCAITDVERASAAPEVPAVAEAPKKVETEDLEKADKKACTVTDGTYLTLDLVGAKVADGTLFTSTWDEQRPVTARLGQGQLLTGLEEGLAGMRVGARRQITIPADKAYGPAGNPAQGIGKDEALTFVVDLVGVTQAPLFCNAARDIPAGTVAGKPTTVDMPVEAPAKLATKDLTVGTGEEAADGKYVTVNYLGVSCSSGMQFDSSWDSGTPFSLTLGAGASIEGFDEGLVGLKVGGRRQIDIPSEQAYGAAGQGADIGPSDPLTFIVELVSVADEPPASSTVPVPGEETTTTAGGDETTTTTAAEATSTTAG